ncbi:MAG: baseplate J/gp47 family protein [Desulfobacteraceae bacterium]|nr:baseplate J/gp47 family protein [Desulfobacteraceae bacterium]
MAFDRPDLQTLITRTTADLNSRFSGTYNRMRRMVLAVIARVLAGLAHGLYGFLAWIAEQIFTDTMDDAQLRRDGAIYGVPYDLESKASGTLEATGTDGSVIEADTLYQRADGAEFIVLAEAEIVGGVADVSIQASNYGVEANTESGETLTLVSPVSGVNPEATVDENGITGGLDAMSMATYKQRVIDRKRIYFTGSNAAIYKKWALEVSGVTRAWVYENTPVDGSVTVLFVCDDEADIIPDAAKIGDVKDYLEEHTDPATGIIVGRGVNVTLVVDGPVAQEVDFTILPSPNTSAVRAAILGELSDMIRRDAEPGENILISHIREAISIAAGENDYTLTSPIADETVAAGSIAVMGTITWA